MASVRSRGCLICGAGSSVPSTTKLTPDWWLVVIGGGKQTETTNCQIVLDQFLIDVGTPPVPSSSSSSLSSRNHPKSIKNRTKPTQFCQLAGHKGSNMPTHVSDTHHELSVLPSQEVSSLTWALRGEEHLHIPQNLLNLLCKSH